VVRASMSTSPDCSAVKTLLGGGRHVFHLLGIAEQGGRDGAAGIDVEAGPLALAVGDGEAGDAGADAANELPACLDGVEILAGLRRSAAPTSAAAATPAATYLLNILVFPS